MTRGAGRSGMCGRGKVEVERVEAESTERAMILGFSLIAGFSVFCGYRVR